jgi:hypothetical protein
MILQQYLGISRDFTVFFAIRARRLRNGLTDTESAAFGDHAKPDE